MTPEHQRLEEARERTVHWKRWGPYLSERQWGTVREDYSAHGTTWDYFPHDHARSRAYRWGEDGLAGISDNHQRLCFGSTRISWTSTAYRTGSSTNRASRLPGSSAATRTGAGPSGSR